MSFKYGSLTLKRRKVDPDQSEIKVEQMSTTIFDLLSQSSPNCWTCFVFSSMNRTICFLRSKLTPPSPASSPLEVLQGKCLSHQEGHKESTHLPKRVEKIQTCRCNCCFRAQGRKFFYQDSLHPGLIIENDGSFIFCFGPIILILLPDQESI